MDSNQRLTNNQVWEIFRNNCMSYTGNYEVTPGQALQIANHVCASSDYPRVVNYTTTGSWFEARTIDELQAFYLSRLPEIRAAAKKCGYAIGMHGSARRDFDLMAMPWTDECSTADELAHAIATAACGITREGPYQWETKPQGRIATSFTVCWTDHSEAFPKDMLSLGCIDLSIMLPVAVARDAEN